MSKFAEEAKKVSDWYQTFEEDEDKLVGPGSIIGLKFWDGGDDIDYINSAILGFAEYFRVAKDKEDYLSNFSVPGYLTENSSEEWKTKINNLAELFGQLTEEERKNLWKEFPDYFDEDPGEYDGEEEDDEDYGDEEEAEEAVGQTGAVTPEIEKAAYDWVDKQFAEDSDLYDEDYNFNFEEFDKRKETAGYPIDLLNWIDDCLQQMDDTGYEYEVFVSLFGHYPGEGNWTPGENDYGEEEIEPYTPEDDVERELYESLKDQDLDKGQSKGSATESNSSIKGKDEVLTLMEEYFNEDPNYDAIKTPTGITVKNNLTGDEISFSIGVELKPEFKIIDHIGNIVSKGFDISDLSLSAVKAIKEYLK